ncbi:MAG: hypothetical protein JWM32_2889 [Verrucomicrobia bacterium]|nr:hypothetical protein [Verrucomicrobiota bacterium]
MTPLLLLRRFVILVAFACFGLSVRAADDAVKSFNLPAGPAEKTLRQYSEQSGVQVIYPTSTVRGITTKEVRGNLTPRDALDQMLDGTALVGVHNEKSGILTLRRESSPEIAEKNVSSRPASSRTAVDENGNSIVKLGTFEVFERKTLNMDKPRSRDDTQPYIVLNREQIQRSGDSNVADFLRNTLTATPSGADTTTQNGVQIGNNSLVNLRGLGSDQTLILIDGRRAATISFAGAQIQPDLNAIPLSAIERIEVLPTTASGIYGGSATGGVINVILRRDYNGVTLSPGFETAYKGDAFRERISLLAGMNLGAKTHFSLTAGYSHSDDFNADQRTLIERARAQIFGRNPALVGSPSVVPPLSSTTNIRSLNPAESLVLKSGTNLNSAATFVPKGYRGMSTDNGAAFVANRGRYNLELAPTAQLSSLGGGGKQSLLAGTTTKSLIGSLRQTFSPKVEGFAEWNWSSNRSLFNTSSASSTFVVLATSPVNPFNQTIIVTTPVGGTDQDYSSEIISQRISFGLIFQLPGTWKGEMDFLDSRNRLTTRSPSSLGASDSTGNNAASAVSSGKINVFQDVGQTPDFSPYLLSRPTSSPTRSSMNEGSVRVSGALPGAMSAATLSFAATLRNEDFDTTQQTTTLFPGFDYAQTYYGGHQRSGSVYAEARVPLVSQEKRLSMVESLEIQLALRADQHRIVGNGVSDSFTPVNARRTERDLSSVNPTIGLAYKPVSDLMLRASVGTGFLPPTSAQLVPNLPNAISGSQFNLTDQLRGNEVLGDITHTAGGNPDLKAERSRSMSVGTVLTPKAVPGLRISVDYTRIRKNDEIDQILGLDAQSLGDLISYAPSRVTRGAPGGGYSVGPITAIDATLINVAQSKVDAYDIGIEYRRTTARGNLTVWSNATCQPQNWQQITKSLPPIENAGKLISLRWKGNAGVAWEAGSFSASGTARYFDGYALGAPNLIALQGSERIPSQAYFDVAGSYRWPSTGGPGRHPEWNFTLGIKNIFNQRPPIDVSNTQGLYSYVGDPRGGVIYLKANVSF